MEIKLDKLRGRSGPEGIDERHLKRAEINKINEYCQGALSSFVHFLHLYAKTADRQLLANKNAPFLQKSLEELKDVGCIDPDEGSNQLFLLLVLVYAYILILLHDYA